MLGEIGEIMQRSVSRYSKCCSCPTLTRNFLLLWLLSLSAGVACSFNKCCPFGEVFSGMSKVDCVASPRAPQIVASDPTNKNVTYGQLPICQKPEYITTLSLDEINSADILQSPYCIDILYNDITRVVVPTLVYCKSNEDKDRTRPFPKAPSLSEFLNVRKCCSNNTVFNVVTGGCEFDRYYSKTNHFLPLLTDYLRENEHFPNVELFLLHTGMPKCSSGAIFTHEIDSADIINGTLQVTLATGTNESTVESFSITERNSCLELMPHLRSKRRFVVRVCKEVEYCRDHRCIQKCCPTDADDGGSYICPHIAKSEKNFYEEMSNITGGTWDMTEYGVRVGLDCSNFYEENMNGTYGLTPNGFLKLTPSIWLPPDMYCVDSLVTDNTDGLLAFICFLNDGDDAARLIISSILMGTSCIFLFLTLIVYLSLPVLQNLHGKTLMCHIASLLVGYLCLTVIPWITVENDSVTPCGIVGYIMFFSMMSAFSWLNVMCFDIWQTFGKVHSIRSQNHNKRFLLYGVYAWGVSMFIMFICILSDQMHILPENLRPEFGLESCWFNSPMGHAELIFFTAPVTIQLITNIVFFILTAKECNKVKAEISKVSSLDVRSKRFHSDKTKFIMNVKLFVVMGMSWSAEVVSKLLKTYTGVQYQDELFYVTDVVNSLQGVLIFVLFVVKRRVHKALKKRLGYGSKKKREASSTLQDPYRVVSLRLSHDSRLVYYRLLSFTIVVILVISKRFSNDEKWNVVGACETTQRNSLPPKKGTKSIAAKHL
ncbi:putative G-protein coupled receptor Mth-like 3 [Bombus vancouverensis nearcticus]|uniref:G-protein coupled receptor Mth2 isoform X1 n=1 Tax=Bombus bifarius TaxID=103933 RepID=A0A6P8N6H0_9HYME|nr:G-protein coupled receptor Mth2 isoform X1 [Bombus bifarius]